MQTFLSIVYILVCLFLIGVVLLQSGRGGGMGAAFGGGGSTNSVFGGAGAGNLLTRVTAVCAALFMILSATLAYLSSSSEQALERAVSKVEQAKVIKPPEQKKPEPPPAAPQENPAGESLLESTVELEAPKATSR